jgi:hypothetical protein
LPDPCKPSLPLLTKKHGHLGPTFHGHQIFIITTTYSQPISGFLSCNFYSFSTQILLLLAFLLLRLCLLFCWCPLLKAGVPVAAAILAVANIPAVACFPHAVAEVTYVGVCLHGSRPFSRPPIFHRHHTCKTATFLLSGRDDGHLAPLLKHLMMILLCSCKAYSSFLCPFTAMITMMLVMS